MRRIGTVIAVVLVVALGVGVVVALLLRGDGGDPKQVTQRPDESVPSLPTTTTAPLTAAAEDLQTLVEKGRGATFHGVYAGHSASGDYTLELNRSDGRASQELAAEDDTFHTIGIFDGDQAVNCSKQPAADWVCSAVEGDESLVDGVFGEVFDGLLAGDIETTDDTVAGHAVRCFANDTLSVCLTDEGIPVKAVTPIGDIELTELSDEVDDAAFEPPVGPAND